jgi:hypothetical protein
MSCNHKFINDLDLSYASWTVNTLFIGTFNPGWHCTNNYAEWFYGRTNNNEFWTILPLLHNRESLKTANKSDWLDFCRKENIGITDILTSIPFADVGLHFEAICKSNFSDSVIEKNFNARELVFTDLISILKNRPSIRTVCITRRGITGIWKKALSPVLAYCEAHNIAFLPLRSPSRFARNGTKGYVFTDYVSTAWLKCGYPGKSPLAKAIS